MDKQPKFCAFVNEFVFPNNDKKKTLSIKKSKKIVVIKAERGTHTKLVTVHRKGKTFKRKQRVGQKEEEKKEISKSILDPENLESIAGLNDSGVAVVGGIHEEETFICKFKDGSSAIHKTMLPGDIVGEVGAYETSKILGWDIVPETIKCDYGKGSGSTQKWIEGGSEPLGPYGGDECTLGQKHMDDLSKILILDMVTGNFDRHDGNLIIKDDKVYAIDNEMWGKGNNAKLHMEGLEEFAKNGSGSYMPMYGVLMNNFGEDPESYQEFKSHVDKNIDVLIDHKDEVLKYWDQYKGDKNIKGSGSIPGNEAIGYIKKNIDYLEQYRK